MHVLSPQGLAASLLGKPRRAAFAAAPIPRLLALTPAALARIFAPVAPIGGAPLRRRLATPLLPARRRRRIVPDGDTEKRQRDERWLDYRPRTTPAGPDVPTPTGEGPILVRVEEDVGGSARGVVDGSSRYDHEGRRTRQVDADVDAHAHLRLSGDGTCGHEQRHEDQSLHGRLHRFRWEGLVESRIDRLR